MMYGAVAFGTYTMLPEGTAKTVLVSALVTSGLLHYYYDGFIWKLRRSETREGLALEDRPSRDRSIPVPATDRRAFMHLAAFIVAVAGLAAVEYATPAPDPVAAAREVVALVPGNATSQANAGNALLERGRVQDALPHLREAVRLAPTADARTKLAGAALASGGVDEALAEIAGAIRLDPRFADAYVVRGDVFLRRREWGNAVRDYQEAIGLGVRSPVAHGNLGRALIEVGQFDAAERELRTALGLDPGLVSAHLNLGSVLDRTGRVADAMAQFAAAVRLRPNLAEAHDALGLALLKLGRSAEAANEFRTALQINPTLESAKRRLAEVSGR